MSPSLIADSVPSVRATGLAALRRAVNPFAMAVATAGTEETCLLYNVRGLFDSQLADLRAVVGLYRDGATATRVYPILGQTGTGKTHLLAVFQDELRQQAEGDGTETLVVVADHFSLGQDAINFLLTQVVNAFLLRHGSVARVRAAVAARLTARLLAEAIRQLVPHQQAALIPQTGFGERLATWLARPGPARRRLEAITDLVQVCDVPHPTADSLRTACKKVGFPVASAMQLIGGYLGRRESRDVTGWLRRELYLRLARFALADDQEEIEDFLTGGYLDAPAHAAEAGQLQRRLLTTFLELFREFRTPLVVVFDQLENYLRAATPEREAELYRQFSIEIASLVNNVPTVAIMVFGEQSVWNGALERMDVFARGRLSQDFELPGPRRQSIEMPRSVTRDALVEMIRVRIRTAAPDLDSLPGLPPEFPFRVDQVDSVLAEGNPRECIRRLSRLYNDIVHGTAVSPPPPPPGPGPLPPPNGEMLNQFRAHWQTALVGARKRIKRDQDSVATLIPDLQAALVGWWITLQELGLTGSAPWAKTELVTDQAKGLFGHVSVIRSADNAPGVGVAVWLAERRWKPDDLRGRLAFFDRKPCPINTLVLFRRDGEAALTGMSGELFQAARAAGRDVRVEKFDPKLMEAILAFASWLQMASPDAGAAGAVGQVTLRCFVEEVSKELLVSLDEWRKPAKGVA